jgi:ribosomal protein L24
MGPTDGKWTTIYSGLAEDDEVVVDGVYQLKLATSAQATKGGHFEADGTWHEGGEH